MTAMRVPRLTYVIPQKPRHRTGFLHNARAAATCVHGATIKIGQRDLLIGCGEYLLRDRRQFIQLRFQFLEFLL
jgi:hypothetical protein